MPYQRTPLKNVLNVTKIVTLYYFEFSPDYKTQGESHDFWEMVYVDSGELDVTDGETVHHLMHGEVLFHKPNRFHRVSCDGEHAAAVFIISFDCRSPAIRFFEGKRMTLEGALRDAASALVLECTRCFHISSFPLKMNENAPFGALQLVRNSLESFLIRLMQTESDRQNSPPLLVSTKETFENSLVNGIHDYLRENLYGRVTLSQLGEHFHFSISTVCTIYRKNVGESIMSRFMKMKLDEAKRLLRETTMRISDISDRLSFDSPQHFSRMFRRYSGRSPRDYRNSPIERLAVKPIKR